MKNFHKKLRGKIVEKFGSQNEFAKALGISAQTLSCKMNRKVAFTLKDVQDVSLLLDIPKGDIYDYFFAENVQKLQHKEV